MPFGLALCAGALRSGLCRHHRRHARAADTRHLRDDPHARLWRDRSRVLCSTSSRPEALRAWAASARSPSCGRSSWPLAVALLLVWRIRHVRLGRAMIAVREDDVAAEAMGINLTRTKLLSFGLGALIAGHRRRLLRPPGVVHRCQPVRLHAVGRHVSLCHPGRRRKSARPDRRRGHSHAGARDAARHAGLAHDRFRHALGRDGDLASRRVAAAPCARGADERYSQRRRCEPPLRRLPRFERCVLRRRRGRMFMP